MKILPRHALYAWLILFDLCIGIAFPPAFLALLLLKPLDNRFNVNLARKQAAARRRADRRYARKF